MHAMLSLTLVLMSAAAATAAMPCERLDALATPHVSIRAASTPEGPFVAPGAAPVAGGGAAAPQAPPLPAHCRVRMVLKPTADSNINAELWLPMATWNGKFMAVG